jgi:hypothetical protein
MPLANELAMRLFKSTSQIAKFCNLQLDQHATIALPPRSVPGSFIEGGEHQDRSEVHATDIRVVSRHPISPKHSVSQVGPNTILAVNLPKPEKLSQTDFNSYPFSRLVIN